MPERLVMGQMEKMTKLFDVIPSGFFIVCPAIVARIRIRDAIAVYLLENHVDFIEEDRDKDKHKKSSLSGARRSRHS